jgi:hypothetical protein
MTRTSLQRTPHEAPLPLADSVAKELIRFHQHYLPGAQLREQLPFFSEKSWREFADSWNNLHLDAFMKDKGKYRLRRFSEWEYTPEEQALRPLPARPYTQPLYINPLNGGISRTYEPFEAHVVKNEFFNGLMRWCLGVFNSLEGASGWEVQVFQNRIIASSSTAGLPTPEGVHRDGVSYILMMLIDRVNVTGGETTLYDREKKEVGKLTMRHPMDCVLANDEQTLHGVTPILADGEGGNAYRDMLIAMFTKRASPSAG